jgi:hypothetical protein
LLFSDAFYWLGPAALSVPLICIVVAVARNSNSTPAVVLLFALEVFFVAVGSVRCVGAVRAGQAYSDRNVESGGQAAS